MGVTSIARIVPRISGSSSAQASLAQSSRDRSNKQIDARRQALLWSCIGLLTAGGFWGVAPVLVQLWEIWTTDPLRSIGMFILPTCIVLILRAWRQNAWELKGTWWGLLPLALAYAPAIFSEHLVFMWSAGSIKVSFLPYTLPIYLYVCGIVLLFAGVRVWLRAWFPLALLLLLQPVPQVIVQFLDLPMQDLSAHIARSFAALLGLSPANTELLRLMFTPSFGMFIAPGCDGMRGAVTMAYGALIAGYLKRVTISKWFMYVAGAFLLGHIFNLLRLCALVVYYKVALGHSTLEHLARQADYMIGGLLFLVAVLLFLWMMSGKVKAARAVDVAATSGEDARNWRPTYWRTVALALFVIAAIVPGIRANRTSSASLAQALRQGEFTAQNLNSRIPSQLGSYRLVRTWQERMDGYPVLQAAAFAAAPTGEVELGIWLPSTEHSIQASLMTHGESPKIKAIKDISTAGGQPVSFNIALYDDGVTDTFVGDTYCGPSSCVTSVKKEDGMHFSISKVMDPTVIDHSTWDTRLIPIFFKMEVPHSGASDQAVYSQLLSECQHFLSNVDFPQLSQRFQ